MNNKCEFKTLIRIIIAIIIIIVNKYLMKMSVSPKYFEKTKSKKKTHIFGINVRSILNQQIHDSQITSRNDKMKSCLKSSNHIKIDN